MCFTNPEFEGIWEQTRELGLGALAHAIEHAVFAPLENTQWPQLSVLQAAHAAELLIKARIAQEHPLLLFEQLPAIRKSKEALNFRDLFEQGRTVQWADLPDRLWAATGLSIPNRPLFDGFGKLRNGIQHFAPHRENDDDLTDRTLRFIFGVIDPFINSCWGLFAIDYHEDKAYGYGSVVSVIAGHGILFLVSPRLAKEMVENPSSEFNFSEADKQYRDEMRSRAERAMEGFGK